MPIRDRYIIIVY